ncbi:MAG: methyltransferase domain-containing protein [bacterium]|nr:methyltransferase domain-containing protein [bacterium]
MGTYHTSKNRAIEETLRQKGLFSSTSAPWQQDVLENFLSQVKFQDGSICLDAACGIGNNIETLLKYFQNIIAFDKSAKAVYFAKERQYQYKSVVIPFVVGSLESMPYADNFFDCIICTEALEHVSDYNVVIKEVFRVAKSGGYVVLSFQNHLNFSALLKFLFEKVYKKNWDVWGTHRHKEGYENYLTCFQIKKIIKKEGFNSIKEFGADYINAWFSWVPFLYKNYKILDRYPMLFLGKIPILKYVGMDYFLLLKKP